MPFAPARDATIQYHLRGAGPEALLLINGLAANADEWGEAFIAPLAARFRVVVMNNRGIGGSTSARSEWSMQDMVEDVCAVLDHAGIASCHVVGTSMGGMIAQTLAVAYPARVRGLVLIGTTPGGTEAVPPWPEAAALFKPSADKTVAEQRRETLRVITAKGFSERHADRIEELVRVRVAQPTPASTSLAQLVACVQSDRSELVNKIDRPTLVIHGVEDSLIPIENGKLLARDIPGAQLVALEACGHMPYAEVPETCSAAILSFLLAAPTSR